MIDEAEVPVVMADLRSLRADGWIVAGVAADYITHLRTQLAAALAERERDAKDAARYRWLRDGRNASVGIMPRGTWFPNPSDLDACIDAAIAVGGEETPK